MGYGKVGGGREANCKLRAIQMSVANVKRVHLWANGGGFFPKDSHIKTSYFTLTHR